MQAVELDIDNLLQGCLADNRKAQEGLYRQFYGFTMTIALRYSRDEHDAADIMTNAFLRVFRSLNSFDSSKGTLHAWIKKIIVNEGLDHIKNRSRFNENVEVKTVAEEIINLVKRLPPATHAVFVLYAVEGYSHREIAEQLNISEGTSKWHLSEARKTLQKQIQQLYN